MKNLQYLILSQMDFKILVATLLIVGGIVGFTYSANMNAAENDESDLYSAEKSFEVNSSSPNGELSFDNNSIGVWYQDNQFFLDMDGDNSFESELSENETSTGDFVREVVRGEKAYQVYFLYENGTESSSASLQVYRIRQI